MTRRRCDIALAVIVAAAIVTAGVVWWSLRPAIGGQVEQLRRPAPAVLHADTAVIVRPAIAPARIAPRAAVATGAVL